MKNIYIGQGVERYSSEKGSGYVSWGNDLIVIGHQTFQELKQFFQAIKFRPGDKITSNRAYSEECYAELYVVDFNHEAYFCVDGNGKNYEVKFENAREL